MSDRWVVFDLNGTVLDLRPISAALPAPVNDNAAAVGILDEAIFYAMAGTLAGRYAPLSDLLRAAIERRLALAGVAPGSYVDDAVRAAQALPPYPDVIPALDILGKYGIGIATITNSASDTADRALKACGIRERFAHVVGSDTCRAYKPAAAVYRNGLDRMGADPAGCWMVAAHDWDLLGAHRAGMRTARVHRTEQPRFGTLPEPDICGDTLVDIAAAICARR